MIRKIVGMTMAWSTVAYTVYSAVTGNQPFSNYEALGIVTGLIGGGTIATLGDSDSTSTKGDKTLERKLE